MLGLVFLVFPLTVQAQEGSSDPVTSVEVTIGSSSGSGSAQSNAVTVTASNFVYRDAVASVSGKVHCTDQGGNAVPNASVSSVTMSGPGTVSPSSGTTDSNGDLAITVQSTDISTDDTTGTVTATSEKVNGQGSVSFKGALQIKNGNTDVTHAPTSSMIGEQQSLAVSLRSGVAISSATWTFGGGGTPILNWQQSDSNNTSASLTTYIPSSGLTGNSAKFYVTTVGTATVTVSVTDSGGTGSGSTSVIVSEPTDFKLTATENAPAQANLALGLGKFSVTDNSGDPVGIQFTGSGGSGGSLSWAQIVTANAWTVVDNNGARTTKFKKPNLPGLDTSFGYPPDDSSKPNIASDSPMVQVVNNTQVTQINETGFSATMYLMWTSSRSNALPIPVMSQSWSWSANGTYYPATGSPGGLGYGQAPLPAATSVNVGVLNWTQTTRKSDTPTIVP